MDSKKVTVYRSHTIRYTENDGFGVAGFGFFPSERSAWVGTFRTLEEAKSGVDRRLTPTVPVTKVATMNLFDAGTICRKCGQSDVVDGAMFTTDPSSGLCDDCYG